MYFVRNFLKEWFYSPNVKDYSVSDQQFKLPECRRRADLIETFKIMNGLVDYGQNMFRKNSAYQTRNLPVISHHSLRSAHDFFRNRLSNIVTSYHKQSDVQQVSTPLRPVSIVLKSSKPDSNGFWELSEQIFNGISEKSDRVNYSLANHDVAMQQNVLF